MSDRYACAEGPRQVGLDIRQSTAEVLALGEPAVVHEALGYHRRPECSCSCSGRGGGRVNLRLPLTPSRMGGRAGGATCPL